MQDWLAVLKWFPSHLLLSQLGLLSSMSKKELPNDLFPVMLFPVEPSSTNTPDKELWSVVLAWISLLFELVPEVDKAIPNTPPLAVLLTTTLLLLPKRTIVSLTLLRTRWWRPA